MRELSEDQLNFYRRLIVSDEKDIKRWERSLQHHIEGVERAKRMIECHKQSKTIAIKQLKENGIILLQN